MEIPTDIEVHENQNSSYWFDKEGILCSVNKKGAPKQSLEDVRNTLTDFYKILNGRKVCLLADATYTQESTKEVRDYVAKEFPKFIKAIAIVTKSPLGKMLANLFFTIANQPYPIKMFTHEADARKWLHDHL